MPGYKATVFGENFEFLIDDEPQYLDFTRTLYLDAEDEQAAAQTALAMVREELLAQALWDEGSDQAIDLDEIEQVDVLARRDGSEDFIWTFPDLDDED